MRLLRIPEPFDHPDFLYEVKHDGFRALASVKDGACQLVSRTATTSRRGRSCQTRSPVPSAAHRSGWTVRSAVSILTAGRNFYRLMFRRDRPFFYAFDVLAIDGEDLRMLPLLDRKRRLRAIVPRQPSRLLHVDAIEERGTGLFRLACRCDLEGIVAKWARGTYQCDGRGTSWLKIKNPQCSQMEGRRELFEARRDHHRRKTATVRPELRLV
jgi:bifunctional non-homologous end joining protein LigD